MQKLIFDLTVRQLHWEFPFELTWMLWLQEFKSKIKDRCAAGKKRKSQLFAFEELQLHSQRIKKYQEGFSEPFDEQDILLTDAKHPP